MLLEVARAASVPSAAVFALLLLLVPLVALAVPTPCEGGWGSYATSCYRAIDEGGQVSFGTANLHCTALGPSAHLTIVSSADENTHVANLIASTVSRQWVPFMFRRAGWIGLLTDPNVNKLLGPAAFHWVDGTPLVGTYQNWQSGEPFGGDLFNSQFGVEIDTYSGSDWNDFPYGGSSGLWTVRGEVCERPFCGNGIIDAGEACDDGNSVSFDGCSSTCASETGWGLCPSGWRSLNGRCYTAFMRSVAGSVWQATQDYCQLFNASLVSLQTQAEIDLTLAVARDLFTATRIPPTSSYVGLYSDLAGVWYWTDGTPVADVFALPWDSGFVPVAAQSNACAQLFTHESLKSPLGSGVFQAGTLMSASCSSASDTQTLTFVCEQEQYIPPPPLPSSTGTPSTSFSSSQTPSQTPSNSATPTPSATLSTGATPSNSPSQSPTPSITPPPQAVIDPSVVVQASPSPTSLPLRRLLLSQMPPVVGQLLFINNNASIGTNSLPVVTILESAFDQQLNRSDPVVLLEGQLVFEPGAVIQITPSAELVGTGESVVLFEATLGISGTPTIVVNDSLIPKEECERVDADIVEAGPNQMAVIFMISDDPSAPGCNGESSSSRGPVLSVPIIIGIVLAALCLLCLCLLVPVIVGFSAWAMTDSGRQFRQEGTRQVKKAINYRSPQGFTVTVSNDEELPPLYESQSSMMRAARASTSVIGSHNAAAVLDGY